MKLTTTNDKLQIVLGGSVTTNQLQCVVSYKIYTTTTTTDGKVLINTNNTTDVDLAGAPSSGEVYDIQNINIFNNDTTAQTVTIKIDVSGTETILHKRVLDAGATLTWSGENGWVVYDTYMPIKSFTVHGDAGANFAMTNATLAERFAGNTTRHIFAVDLLGYTQVRFRVNKQVVGTAGSLFRAKYYSSFSATVGNYLQLGLSAQVEASMAATGYYDSGWVDLALGARINACYIAFTELGGDGVADPAIGATDILFR